MRRRPPWPPPRPPWEWLELPRPSSSSSSESLRASSPHRPCHGTGPCSSFPRSGTKSAAIVCLPRPALRRDVAFLRRWFRSAPSSPPPRFALGLAFVKSGFPRLYACHHPARGLVPGAQAFPDTFSFPRIHPFPGRTSESDKVRSDIYQLWIGDDARSLPDLLATRSTCTGRFPCACVSPCPSRPSLQIGISPPSTQTSH